MGGIGRVAVYVPRPVAVVVLVEGEAEESLWRVDPFGLGNLAFRARTKEECARAKYGSAPPLH